MPQKGKMRKYNQRITAANMPQKGKMRKYNQRITAANMPQKGKMRKIQPADNCGKYAAERGNEKNYDK